jgi:sodium/hydrogen antiporter
VTPVVVFAASALVWALIAGRLARWSVVPPLGMATAGVICGGLLPDIVTLEADSSSFKRVIEVTLAIILFVDATEISHRWLRRTAHIPIRLVGIALPLGVMLAWLIGRLLLTGTVAWLLAALAVLVMVTDSAICAAALSDHRVPADLRGGLTVESGFNDGVASPFVLLFLSAAVAQTDHVGIGQAVGHALREVLIGIAVGVVLGWLAGAAFAWARQHEWSTSTAERLGVLVLALLAYGVAIAAHGGGFVAAFVAALTATATRPFPQRSLRFAHDTGQLLSLAVWFTFGVLARQTLSGGVSWSVIGYAILVLTVARIVPVAIAMLGAQIPWRQVLFLGWLGPRGLATVMFGLIAIGQLPEAGQRTYVAKVVTLTVGLSLFLHGVTSRWLGSWVTRDVPATAASADQKAPQ